jgi:hypothetical protein
MPNDKQSQQQEQQQSQRWAARICGLLYVLIIAFAFAAKPAAATTPACQRCAQFDTCFQCCLCGGNSPPTCLDLCSGG